MLPTGLCIECYLQDCVYNATYRTVRIRRQQTVLQAIHRGYPTSVDRLFQATPDALCEHYSTTL